MTGTLPDGTKFVEHAQGNEHTFTLDEGAAAAARVAWSTDDGQRAMLCRICPVLVPFKGCAGHLGRVET